MTFLDQECSGPENIMAVFSMRPTTWTAKKGGKEAGKGDEPEQCKDSLP